MIGYCDVVLVFVKDKKFFVIKWKNYFFNRNILNLF